jgi:uncharacterized protein YndB with AHSA1/START domain
MAVASKPTVAKTQMMIRRPIDEVFEALIDPRIASRYWFSKGSARLEAGTHVRWDWEMYGVSADVDVQAIEENKRILVEWNPENPSFVEFLFQSLASDRTLVSVRNWGFRGDSDTVVAAAVNSAAGFSFVLAAMKAFLEHHINLNLVADHDPAALVGHSAQSGRA